MEESGSTLIFRRAPRALSQRGLRAYATLLERMVAEGRHFGCLLSDDRELRRLNRQFLDRDYPTDVLSFPALAPSESLGEIAISTTRAAKQARQHGHKPLAQPDARRRFRFDAEEGCRHTATSMGRRFGPAANGNQAKQDCKELLEQGISRDA